MNKSLFIIAAVLMLAAAPFAFAGGSQEEREVPQEFGEPDRVIHLTADGMVFFLEGEDEPNPVLTVQEGETVEIRLTVTRGTHDWVVDEFGASTEIIGSGETSVTVFTTDQSGVFEYYCSFANHRAAGMYGTLVVQ